MAIIFEGLGGFRCPRGDLGTIARVLWAVDGAWIRERQNEAQGVAKTRRHEGRVAGVQGLWPLVGVLSGVLAALRISGSRCRGAGR